MSSNLVTTPNILQQNQMPAAVRQNGLQRRDQALVPADEAVQRNKRANHYIFSAALDFDFTNKRQLSRKIFPRARVCLLESYHYPAKNRSEAAFKDNSSEPDIVALEHKAGDQAQDLNMVYGVYGLGVLLSVRGYDPEVVAGFEEIILPDGINDEKDEIRAAAYEQINDAPKLFAWLTGAGIDRIQVIQDRSYYPVVAGMLQEMINITASAQRNIETWIQETELELAKSAAGQKAKASLDPLDHLLYKSMGKVPKNELLQRMALGQQQPTQIVVQQDPTLILELAQLKADLALVKERSAAPVVVAPVETRATKDCDFCGETILAVAKFCKVCRNTLTPASAPVAVAPAPAAPAATSPRKPVQQG